MVARVVLDFAWVSSPKDGLHTESLWSPLRLTSPFSREDRLDFCPLCGNAAVAVSLAIPLAEI